MIFLTKADYIAINKLILKRSESHSFGIQYPQGLDIIVDQPKRVIFGRDLYPTIWLKTAFIIQKITKKHAFMDGNKRTALISGLSFLKINGFQVSFTDAEGEVLILSVTNSPDSEEIMLRLAEWLKKHSI